MSLTRKIDFALVFSVKHANPNGDPLNGNRPRIGYDGRGEVSDVCLKRKIRNRLQDMGTSVFVQSDDRKTDDFTSLKERAEKNPVLMKANDGKSRDTFMKAACAQWLDVRAFGQVFAYKKLGTQSNVSVGVRGPVSIHSAFSLDPVLVEETQITKSVNNEPGKDATARSSDTMGMKFRVDFGMYVTFGSINTQLAEKTGFSDEDAELIRQALLSLFENDVSSARPDGSMEVVRLFWWTHSNPSGQHSSAKVHRSVKIQYAEGVTEPRCASDYIISTEPLDGLDMQQYEGV